ncbi:MAG: aldo/keto reductase [Acidobacteriia bacterium]|nr:aldo/keto reductase [Terriglobia bacterium]
MNSNSSRRNFLAAGVALPLAGAVGLRQQAAPVATAQPGSAPRLSYRVLGRTGLKVTTVGFGCMVTSDASVVERAADLGINYFDTARGYQQGNNERMVGAALRRKRKDLILSTKSIATDKPGALKDLETSLQELSTDYVDIWYLHNKRSPEQMTDELIEAQQVAKQQGKTRFTGVSTHAPKDLIPAMIQKGVMDVVLATYNFSMDEGTSAAIEQASKAGLGVVGMKVMAGGFRRRPPGPPPPGHGAPPGRPPGGRPPEPPAQLQRTGAMLAALKWVLKNPNVHTTIPGITDMDQLDENLRAMAEPYGAAEEKLLAQQLEYIAPLYCRMCGECAGTCAKGLPVADILRHLSYAEGYGQFALGREEFLKLGPEVVAARCSDCEHCTVTCPHGVQITARLSRAQELFA